MAKQSLEIEPVDVHVGRQLQVFRLLAGMTQKTLADAIGVTPQQLRKYEAAQNRITANKLFRAANALSVSVADFFSGSENAGGATIDLEFIAQLRLFLHSEEGRDLVTAFPQIADKAVRKQILALAKAVAGPNIS